MEEERQNRMNLAEVFQATNSTGDSSFFEKDSNSSILKETIEKKTVPTKKYGMNPEVFRAASTGKLSFFDEHSNSTLLQVTVEKNTVLHVALQFKQVEAAEKILNLSPSLVSEKNSKDNTPLHVAAMVGASSLVKILIQKANNEQDVEADGQQLLSMVNLDGDTALHLAVRYGNFDVVKELINENDPAKLAKKKNNAGESALFLAVDRQDYVMASYILRNAPHCSYAGRNGMNVLHALVIHTSSFKPKLIPWTYLRRPCTPDIDFVKGVIIKWPSTIDQEDDLGWTPLHIATQLDNEKYVKLLLEYGNSPAYKKNNEGLSALHIAAKKGNVNVMKELITTCPDIYEFLDLKGQTALHVAAKSGEKKAVEFFLKRPEFESLIKEQDEEGNTPMHLAAINGHLEIANLLSRGRGVDLNATNKGGFTTMDNFSLRTSLKDFQPTNQLWTKGARPSLRGARIQMGIQKLDPKEGSEDNKMSTSELDYMKQRKETDLLVAALITTVTFTAGFTVPGGYKSEGVDEGMAALSKRTAFRVFLIANTIAFSLSMTSVIIHFWNSVMTRKRMGLTLFFTFYSTPALMVAFISGTYTVVPHNMGITAASILCCCLLYNYYFRSIYKAACYCGIRRIIIDYAPYIED